MLNLPYLTFVIIVERVVAEKRPYNAVRAVHVPASSAGVI